MAGQEAFQEASRSESWGPGCSEKHKTILRFEEVAVVEAVHQGQTSPLCDKVCEWIKLTTVKPLF